MSVRLTLGQLRNDLRIAPVANVCADDARLAAWASSFQERAFALGRWWGSVQLARFCVSNSCVVLPRDVALIEAAQFNNGPTQLQNLYYQFVRPHADYRGCGPSLGVGSCRCGCGCNYVTNIQDRDTVCSFRTTLNARCKLRTYITSNADIGKTVIYQGYDTNGTWVRTEDSDGNVIDGEEVVLASPFVDTETIWAKGSPQAVIKEQTEYNVRLFSVDQDSSTEIQLGNYQPTELTPTYRRMYVPGGGSAESSNGCGCSGSSSRQLLAIVGLQPIPLSADQDWLLFRNTAAYKMGIQAEKYYEEGNPDMGDRYFYGGVRPARNGRGVLRHTNTQGAISILEAETRRLTGDLTTVQIQMEGWNSRGFV